MNKIALASLTLLCGIGIGFGANYWYSHQRPHPTDSSIKHSQDEKRKPLYYRNPMNPEITSPTPAKDDMGMDYIPVYAPVNTNKTPVTDENKRKILYYRNPMNPEITSPKPAKDSMGMDYLPVYDDELSKKDKDPAGTVEIDPATVQNIGVRTAPVTQQALSHEIRTVGRVTYDEERITRLHPKTEGWVEKMFVDKTGTPVKKNTMLLSLYSPQLVLSAQEYLLALKSAKTLENSPYEDIRDGAAKMAKTSKERLQLLDVPQHQIREMEHTGKIIKYLHIHSPFNGIVIHIGAREGQHITPQTELYMLADLSKVWVMGQVYEADLPWVNVGDPVEMTLEAIPGKVFKGKVAYIYPYAEEKTRTIKVRLAFDNPKLLLKPDMFANITIKTHRQADALTIPSEAIVNSGQRDIVFIVRGEGKYEPRVVRTGLSADGRTQILQGLQLGDRVVSSSQFLIDSESKLQEATARMLESLKADKTLPVHSNSTHEHQGEVQ